MKIAYYKYKDINSYGIIRENIVYPVIGNIFKDFDTESDGVPVDEVKLLAPIRPRKLVCVGLNYELHAKESKMDIPDEPMIFMCSPAAIIGTQDTIELDNKSDCIDYEAELAIVIKKEGKNILASQYQDYILGYTCGNDVSNRDLQKKDGQFTRAKSFDTYKPLGPYIETELNPNKLDIKLWQNGEMKQSSNTSDMIFSVDKIIEFISHIMTLEPGDVILTGTPSGIGKLEKGDFIKVEIENIGELLNDVK
ncbi:fumarylacetoacetate hydrolase family protein [Virgibacillus byunsanensis]|uniref:Fumarylacetoacetate hydrolase family protein n=1 Tax=Virgibacillus byunsanensis TaxID=570945 RepID=A0ABW3LRM2_9BACI